MAGNTFTPKPGTGYFNLSGPNQGLTGLGAGPIGPSKPGYVQGTAGTVPLPRQQGVLGAATSSGGGGGGAPASTNTSPFDAAGNAARQQNDAYLSSLNTQYDQNAANLNGQLGDLGTQKDQGINSLNSELDSVKAQVGTERTSAQTNNDNQVIDAGSIAHSTQMQNRNILRSLGILNSSAAGEMLSKPMDEFGKVKAQLGTQLTQRFNQLDDFLNTQVASHQNAVQSIQQNYQSLVGKIQSDLRFNDRQRADAVKAANAALTGHLADIQTSLLNYQNQINQAKQGYASQVSQVIQGYQQPNADTTGISGATVAGQDQGQQGINLSMAPQKKNPNTLSGLVG